MIAASLGKGRYGNLLTALENLDYNYKGKTLLKPNLVAGGLAATHIDAVRAALDAMDIDAIAEGSSVDTGALYKSLGYTALAREYGVELIDLNDCEEWDEIEFLNIQGDVSKVRVSKFADYDVVSLTLPKTHDHAIVTLTVKNMIGFLHPEDRSMVHGYAVAFGKLMGVRSLRVMASHMSKFKALRRFYTVTDVEDEKYIKGARVIHKNIATLAKHVNLKLGLIDGFLGMHRRGPIAGEPLYWDMAIAGPPLECDAYCTRKMGFQPRDVGYLYYMGAPDPEEVEVVGDVIPERKFAPHPKIELQMRWRVPTLTTSGK